MLAYMEFILYLCNAIPRKEPHPTPSFPSKARLPVAFPAGRGAEGERDDRPAS